MSYLCLSLGCPDRIAARGGRLSYLISVTVVTFGKIVHEGIEHAVLIALGPRLPARHIKVPQPRLARADDAGEAAVARRCVLDHIGVEFPQQQLQGVLHGREGLDLES